MADTDYEELEKLFHSDLQSLDLQESDDSGSSASHLPEWLIGVIVLVILLIITFFALVIYSVMKERQKNRASYAGTVMPSAGAQGDVEGSKSDTEGIRITSFNHDQPKDSQGLANGQAAAAGSGDAANTTTTASTNGGAWTLEQEVASTLQRRHQEYGGGVSGCMNPAFIDDDADDNGDDKGAGKKRSKDGGKNAKTTPNGNAGSSTSASTPETSTSPTNHIPTAEASDNNGGADSDATTPEVNCKVGKGAHHGHEYSENGQENGNSMTLFGSSENGKDSETADEETNVDEVEVIISRGSNSKEVPPADAGTPNWDVFAVVNQPRHLEVLAQVNATTCVQIHTNGEVETSSGFRDNCHESSTDDKEPTDLSTNL